MGVLGLVNTGSGWSVTLVVYQAFNGLENNTLPNIIMGHRTRSLRVIQQQENIDYIEVEQSS